jgi:hypothetical protein
VCRTFERLGQCKFAKCAYTHRQDKDSNNKEVEKLKETVTKLTNLCGKLQLEALETHDKYKNMDERHKAEVNEIKKDMKLMSKTCDLLKLQIKNINNESRLRKEMPLNNKKGRNNHNFLICEMCDYKCAKEITLEKHKNTKHLQANFPCESCEDQFVSKVDLKSHMEREHTDLVDNHKNEHYDDGPSINNGTNKKELTPEDFEPHGHECSLCEDNFSTQEEYDKHVNEHLQEVNEIDIESLKSGNEIFKCNLCDFQSGQTVAVKDHLKQHIQITLSTTNSKLDKTSEKEKKCQERGLEDRQLA